MNVGGVAEGQDRLALLSYPDGHEITGGKRNVVDDSSAEDGDYCRICRGEGSEEEPLFYPCKCSGSIKYVHQACLMEWLSHSQKKYCELCKTPFRFTKLYDPHMPRRLPTPIFVRQLVVHSIQTVLSWFRYVFVGLVWLGWLPWSMRQVWRVLFFIVDCRWSTQYPQAESSIYESVINSSLSIAYYNLSSHAGNVTGSVQAEGLSKLPQNQTPSVAGTEASNTQFLLVRVVQAMFPSFFRWTQRISADYAANTSSNGQQPPPILNRQTMLGEVSYLRTLTASPTINNTVIDILEGQLICLSLVVVSILLFLIREWVINQQPGGVPDLEDAEAEVAGQPAPPVDRPQPMIDDVEERRQALLAQMDAIRNRMDNINPNETPNDPTDEEDLAIPQEHPLASATINGLADDSSTDGSSSDESAIINHSPRTRPTLTGRNAMNEASSIRRSIEEQGDSNSAWPGLETFKDLWMRADANPSKVLDIIEQEDRQEELAWIVSQMERLRRESLRERPMAGSSRFSNMPETHEHADGEEEESSANLGRIAAIIHEQQDASAHNPFEPTLGEAHDTDTDSFTPNFSADLHELASNAPRAGEPNPTAFQLHGDQPADRTTNGEPSGPQPSQETTMGVDEMQGSNVDRRPSAFESVVNWCWGNELYQHDQEGHDNQGGQDDEHVIGNIEQEAPFVPVGPQQAAAGQNEPPAGVEEMRDPEVAAAAAEAGIDLNNIEGGEELEDLDGIFELVGLQGPITGLIQNVIFSQFLISLALLAGVGIPYVWGMLALHIVSNPLSVFIKLPLAVMTTTIDLTVDTFLFVMGLVFSSIFAVIGTTHRLFAIVVPPLRTLPSVSKLTTASYTLVSRSGARLERTLLSIIIGDGLSLTRMTMNARGFLHSLEELVSGTLRKLAQFASQCVLLELPVELNFEVWKDFKLAVVELYANLITSLGQVQQSISQIKQFPTMLSTRLAPAADISLSGESEELATIEMQSWTARDRAMAVALGYVSVILLGYLYLKAARYIFKLKKGEKVDGIIADIIRQAGGVLKVILIIGIEMIVFPFYCGLLLDVALLPLFGNANIKTRLDFFTESPMTALFVHWFVGTCYMFHFALFVSMCRKIMRRGVLYFIRDPEDPTFHPVRDVLEKNVATQLSKIAFSALVYGGLVMICLGGVVWTLSLIPAVLPVRWASGGPTLEFPIDLVFYTFVLPVLLRNLDPSKKIDLAYKWWFRKVAGWLRLSDFLFGERVEDQHGRHVRRTWWDVLYGKKGDIKNPITGDDSQVFAENPELDAYFVRDGKFVRTPASDSVRIQKGQRVFVEVNQENERIDGQDDKDDGPYGKKNKDYTMVYVPPWFRMRIVLFVGHVWIFTAVVGVCITILPLLIGRKIIGTLSPSTVQPNDLYGFSLGCSLGLAIVYGLVKIPKLVASARARASQFVHFTPEALKKVFSVTKHVLGLAYLGTFIFIVLPMILAILAECYIFVPLHTYLASASSLQDAIRGPYLSSTGATPPHTTYLVQTWVLGILLMRISLRIALTTPNERTLLATALKSIIAPPNYSQFNPNISLATRAFVIPSIILSCILFSAPLLLGYFINQTPRFINQDPEVHAKIYRYSFPGLMAIGACAWCIVLLQKAVDDWKGKIRDEVYLVGERLHNFNEKRTARKDNKGKGRADGSRGDGGNVEGRGVPVF